MTELETLDRLIEIEKGLRVLAGRRETATTDQSREQAEAQWQALEDERHGIDARFDPRISMAFELHRHSMKNGRKIL